MKKNNDHRNYYINNNRYSYFLESSSIESFNVYFETVEKYSKKNNTFLDVGCGTGIVVNELVNRGVNATGVEISKYSLEKAKKKKGIYKLYNGTILPFDNNSFNIVGSFDVIEHVSDVENFLKESKRVLKKNGYLIICTPNFLSVTNSYHHRTLGFKRKLLNLSIILKKYFMSLFNKYSFDNFDPIVRKQFHPDDDAIFLSNIIDITTWAKLNSIDVIESRGSIMPDKGLKKYLVNIPFIKVLFGGVFLVLQKK